MTNIKVSMFRQILSTSVFVRVLQRRNPEAKWTAEPDMHCITCGEKGWGAVIDFGPDVKRSFSLCASCATEMRDAALGQPSNAMLVAVPLNEYGHILHDSLHAMFLEGWLSTTEAFDMGIRFQRSVLMNRLEVCPLDVQRLAQTAAACDYKSGGVS